jgi:protein-S-isoprenylcysteine O-methyltransferase Ste14
MQDATDQLPQPLSPWMWVPPPLLFALPIVVGTRLEHLASLPLPGRVVGFVLLGIALFFIPTAPILFAIHKTTIVPHARARTLIERGPYRISRNPMYVGLVLIYLGVTFLLGTAWPLLFLALPIWVTHSKTIAHEELVLERAFGDEYRSYKERVRRWV